MSSLRGNFRWHLIILLSFILLGWRWLWGYCWNPFETACFEGLGNGDYIQHFYGWLAYAEGKPESVVSPMFSNWTWPEAIPLLYSDPIPIAAIIFRPIFRLLFIKFQYFSLLSLINMMISAFCGYLLGCRVVGSRLLGCTLGVLLALAPPAVLRIGGHEALSLHSLLVVAITLLILRNSTLWIWALMIFVASGVHAYFIPLLLPVVIVRTLSTEMSPSAFYYDWVSKVLRQRSTRSGALADSLARLLDAGSLLLTCFLGLILFGYAKGGMSPVAKGDLWSANLLAFFDSQGHSSIFSPLKKIEPYQWEGFSYFGLIITILVALSLYRLLHRAPQARGQPKRSLFPSPRTYWSLIILALLYSFGFNLWLGDQRLLSLKSFAEALHLDHIYYIFRSTGRFTWPAYYSILLWGFFEVARAVRSPNALALIVLVLLFETHIHTLAQVKSGLAQRYDEGMHWRQIAKARDLKGELAAIIADSDLFFNATGDPYFQTEKIPRFFTSAVNSTIHTNYLPYLPRWPLRFNQMNSGNSCDLAVRAIRLASEQGLQRPLLLLKNSAHCKELKLTPRVRLDDDFSIFSAKRIGPT
jgi:hypothetical protein